MFRAMLTALGVSAANSYDMNSLAVPRKVREGGRGRRSHGASSAWLNPACAVMRGSLHPGAAAQNL